MKTQKNIDQYFDLAREIPLAVSIDHVNNLITNYSGNIPTTNKSILTTKNIIMTTTILSAIIATAFFFYTPKEEKTIPQKQPPVKTQKVTPPNNSEPEETTKTPIYKPQDAETTTLEDNKHQEFIDEKDITTNNPVIDISIDINEDIKNKVKVEIAEISEKLENFVEKTVTKAKKTSKKSSLIKKNIPVSSFNKIESGSIFNIILTIGSKEEVTVEANKETLPKVEVTTKNGQLSIEFNERKIKNPGEINIYVTAKDLDEIELSGVSSLKSTNKITANKFNIEVSGTSHLDIELEASELALKASGISSISLKGKSTINELSTSGMSNLKAKDFIMENCNAEISGTSSNHIHVNKSLNADISGVSHLTYSGNPSKIKTDISGMASVKNK